MIRIIRTYCFSIRPPPNQNLTNVLLLVWALDKGVNKQMGLIKFTTGVDSLRIRRERKLHLAACHPQETHDIVPRTCG